MTKRPYTRQFLGTLAFALVWTWAVHLEIGSGRGPGLETHEFAITLSGPAQSQPEDPNTDRQMRQTAAPSPEATGPQVLTRIEDAPSWAVPYGEEFWQPGFHAAKTNETGGMDLGVIMERVSLAAAADCPSSPPQVRAGNYTAIFENSVSRFGPKSRSTSPPGRDAAELALRTLSFERGDVLYRAGQEIECFVLGNTAQRRLGAAAGVVEHTEARTKGLQISWVFSRPLPGRGAALVQLEVTGLSYAGKSSEGHHFADASGVSRARLGNAFAVDHAGRKWDLSATMAGQVLNIVLPEEVLDQAHYPLALDPLISAEFGMDQLLPAGPGAFSTWPAIASNGDGFFVMGHLGDSGPYTAAGSIRGTRVNAQGTPLDVGGLQVSPRGGDSQVSAVASDGKDYLAVWMDTNGTYAARITATGVVLDNGGLRVGPPGSDLDVACSSNSYIVVSALFTNDHTEIWGTRITATDGSLKAVGFPISQLAGWKYRPQIASNGKGFLVTWYDTLQSPLNLLRGTMLSDDGIAASPGGVPLMSSDQAFSSEHALASNGQDYLVSFNLVDPTLGTRTNYGLRISENGTPMDAQPFVVVRGSLSSRPRVASNGTNYLVVYSYNSNPFTTKDDIGASRIANDGRVVGFHFLRAASHLQVNPSVASNGRDFLAVWADVGVLAVQGALVPGDTNLPITTPLQIATVPHLERTPAVAFNGTDFLVTWNDARFGNSTDGDIFGVRIALTGGIKDPLGLAITRASGQQDYPAVASVGRDFLVAWQDSRNAGAKGLYGNLVRPDGTMAVSNGFAIKPSGLDQYAIPCVAAGPDQYLVAWRERRTGTNNSDFDIYGTRLTPAGVVLDPGGLPICTAANEQGSPVAVFNRTNYLVAWVDARNATNLLNPEDYNIYGARVTPAGVIIDSAGFPICTKTNLQSSVEVTSRGSDYYVSWLEKRVGSFYYDIFATPLSSGAEVAEPNGIAICEGPWTKLNHQSASVAGGNFVVWRDHRRDAPYADVFASFISASGAATSPNGFALSTNPPVVAAVYPTTAVAASPSGRVLVLYDGTRDWNGIFGKFVDFGPTILSITADRQITWAAESDRSYLVQYISDLGSTNWQDLPGTVLATGSTATKLDSSGGELPQRFYRVVLIP